MTTQKPQNIIVLKPRITEKAGILGEAQHIYTFEVPRTATKTQVAFAVKKNYKVTPTKINVVNLKTVKKAMVFLKKGDKIEFA